MSTKQADAAAWFLRTYFDAPIRLRWHHRIQRRGIALPVVSLWSLLAAAQLGTAIAHRRRWSYHLHLPFVTDWRLSLALYDHALAYCAVLGGLGLLGLVTWFGDRPPQCGEGERTTLLALAIAVCVLPTHQESVRCLLAGVGAIGLLNIVSVLALGRPIRTGARWRRRSFSGPGSHPRAEDLP